MRISISRAISELQSGQVVALPTETVYGLAACLNQPIAIEKIFALKGRPHANPLIIHLADINDIENYVSYFPPGFKSLAESFWPGPLTFILPIHVNLIPSIARANLSTAGFRIPSLELTRTLLRSTGPLVMPSANLSGRPSATRPEHIEEDFGKDFPILDGGICSKGVESTILFYRDDEWVIIRLGALVPDHFLPVLGYRPRIVQTIENETQPLCPGQMFRHYAPRARLFLGVSSALDDVSFVLGFKERHYPIGKRVILLGSLLHPEKVAENLYQALRQLDREGAKEVWVDMDFPRNGLWETIAERLIRAGEIA